MKLIYHSAAVISLIVLAFFLGCKEDPPIVPPPPPPPPVYKDTITVTLEDITHRSIIVNVKTTVNNPKSTIKIFRICNSNETQVSEYPITIIDTSIIDDNFGSGLQLNTTYSYYAVRIDTTGERKDSSIKVDARTLAATNFNYSWQEFFIGDTGSVLYDVWGTDENNAYACGIVIINDTVYGVIHWDGIEWKPVKRDGGAYAIFGFSNNDIWVVGGSIFHFDGQIWDEILYDDQVLVDNIPYYSVWGTNSNNVYFGSGRGKIIQWNGSQAQIVYSNPDQVFVNDLDGYTSDFIIGVGMGFVPPLLAVYYNGISWNNLPINNDPSLNSVAIVTRNHIYFGGSGIYEMKGNNFYRIFTSGYYIRDIDYNRQTGVTVAAGPFDGIYINNGAEWRDYRKQISTDDTYYSGIFLVNSTIFCVGSTINEAKIIIGNN